MTAEPESATTQQQVTRAGEHTFQGVQALRLVAAVLVVITHATFYASERLLHGAPYWRAGASGVNIFFVISGFVMVVSSQRLIAAHDWRGFLSRRLARIVPMYWIATSVKLVLLLAVPAVVLHSQPGLLHIVSSYLFIPTTNSEGEFKPLLAVGWTLYFEMFFYIVFALAIWLRANLYLFAGAALGLFSAISIFRASGWPAGTMFFDPIVLQFFFGMLIAWLVGSPGVRDSFAARQPALPAVLVIGGLVALLVFFDAPWPGFAIRTGIASAMIVLGVVWLEPHLRGRIPGTILMLGDASYVIYLFHPIVAPAVPFLLARLGAGNMGVSVAASIVVAVGVGAVIHLLIERRLTKAIRAVFKMGAPSSTATP